jgi:5-methylcytosine-specific restriction enzyme B
MNESIRSIMWHECGASDRRALLGRGGGHEVIAFGHPKLWESMLGQKIKTEAEGGTRIPIVAEPQGAAAFEMGLYLAAGRREVRIKIGEIRENGTQLTTVAAQNAAAVDPDRDNTEKIVVFLIQTPQSEFHLRGVLKSRLPPRVLALLGTDITGFREIAGMALSAQEFRVWQSLVAFKNVLLYGPPGTGKTRTMLSLRQAFEKGVAEITFDPSDAESPLHDRTGSIRGVPTKRKTEFVTFHQSLSYENFVLGMRPVPPASSKQGLSFTVKDGIFLKIAEHAMRKDSASLLLIDEINRGNVADIMGELITIIEPDKRLSEDGKPQAMTVTVTLPLKPESSNLAQQFQMPHHVYILASMNSLDRSVAPLDSALRRRFRMIRIMPDLSVARQLLLGNVPSTETLGDPANATTIEAKSIAIKLLESINARIMGHWGPEFLLGHSYILGVNDAGSLIEAFSETIFPQLFELYRDRQQDLAEILRVEEDNANGVVKLFSDSQSFGMGAAILDPMDLMAIKREEAMRRLYYTAFGKAPVPQLDQ